MSARRLSPDQAEAAGLRAPEVVCTAAAGSGKTAVLTQRVAGWLTAADPARIGQLLVVTFTRAAAAEARRRIAARLRAAGGAGDQRWLLPGADITTLHGFCERLLRRHAAAAGVDPAFRILDPAEALTLQEHALDGAFDAGYAAADAGTADDFADLVERYGGRRLDAGLRPVVARVRAFAHSLPDPEAWLERAAQGGVGEVEARAAAGAALSRCLRRTEAASARAPDPYLGALSDDRALFEELRRAAEHDPWDDFSRALRGAAMASLPPAKGEYAPGAAAAAQGLRQKNRIALAGLREGPFARPWRDITGEADHVRRPARALAEVVRAMDEAYAEAKRRRSALDFDDLEHRCLELLRAPAGRTAAGRYREVLVDEAQDLSPAQDELISLLGAAGPALFAVGDVRQSIYGFRHAEPGRLAARQERAAAGGSAVTLRDNFRSRASVVAACNAICMPLLAAPGAGLPPEASRPLQAAAEYPPLPAGRSEEPVRLVLLEGDADARSATEREAGAVAALLADWLATALVHDGAGAHRPARPGDAAVLLRSFGNGVGRCYADALRARGIPVWLPDEGGAADSTEGRTVLAFIETLQNPLRDIPLAATLLSPLGGFRPQALAEMRLLAPGGPLFSGLQAAARRGADAAQAALWLRRLGRWRDRARRGDYGGLLQSALDEGYLGHASALPDGEHRRANLERLVARCRDAERSGVSDLEALAEYLRRSDRGETLAESAGAAGDSAVVMSVHGSKGLEFPLVVLAGLGRRFHPEEGQDVLVHRSLGLALREVDLDRRVRWPTLAHTVVSSRQREEAAAEELRILYVGLTRAREALHLVGTVRGLRAWAGGHAAAAAHTTAFDLQDGGCWLDWIVPAIAHHPAVAHALGAEAGIVVDTAEPPPECRAPWSVHLHYDGGADAAIFVASPAPPPPAPDAPSAAPPAQTADALWERLDAELAWTYRWHASASLPAKVAVGELARRAGGDDEPTPADGLPRSRTRPGRAGRSRGAPRISGGRPGPEAAGRFTHALLCGIDLHGPCDADALAERLRAMIGAAVLPPEAEGAVDLPACARFLHGDLGRRLRCASTIRREVPFSMRLPAEEVHGTGHGDWVLVQGVIDALVIEPEALVLVDYKTDRTGARAAARHAPQLALYARAAAAAWGRPVREAWLAFLATGEDLPVPSPETAGVPGGGPRAK